MSRKALGRGLSSLLREVEAPPSGLDQIAIALIDANPHQPRQTFPEAKLKELADSIRATGVVQPVVLRPAGERFQLVAGERRWRAARVAGLESIPAIIRSFSDREAVELALTENLLREDLNPLEIARAYDTLRRVFDRTQEQIADQLGIDRTTVTNTLRLLKLPPDVQEMISAGDLTAGHARALLTLESPGAQSQLARNIRDKGLSVRQVESMVALGQMKTGKAASKSRPPIDPNTRAAVLEMERALGTRVRIVGGPKRGKIEINYFSGEDLDRIFGWIVRR